MKLNISIKIIGVVFLCTFILSASLSYINIENYTEDLEKSFIDRAKATAYSMEAGISSKEDILNKDMLLSNIHKVMWLDPEIIDISFNILQEDNLITYVSNDPGNIDKIPSTDNLDSYKDDILISRITEDGSSRILTVITPVHISGQKEGTVQIDFTLENVDNKIRSTINTLVLAYFFIMVLSILVLFFFLRTIVIKPLLKINKGVESISRNDFNYMVDIKSDDEIGKLSQTFNNMTKDLKKSHEEIKKHAQELEQKVAERTKELEKSKKELEMKVDELERFSKLAVGRELKMVELKKRIRELEEQLGSKSK